jgi:bisphosphoglycerate-dependent phosphoglycerate mutase
MNKKAYVKMVAVDPEAGNRLATYFSDQEFYVTQHGTGCIVKVHGQSLKVIEKHLASAVLDSLLAYDPVEK